MEKLAWWKYTDMMGQNREAHGNIPNYLNFMNKEILLFLHKLDIL